MFQFMMLNRRQTPAYDSRYKGWRGPRLESTIAETGDTESMVSPNNFSFQVMLHKPIFTAEF